MKCKTLFLTVLLLALSSCATSGKTFCENFEDAMDKNDSDKAISLLDKELRDNKEAKTIAEREAVLTRKLNSCGYNVSGITSDQLTD
ncbi:MAG: hypothetical protein KF802_02260 [Bdellovibrionaceae bacterium]|nr:hypothetical protein [Pseudobdellovibrionaceae bacterium]